MRPPATTLAQEVAEAYGACTQTYEPYEDCYNCDIDFEFWQCDCDDPGCCNLDEAPYFIWQRAVIEARAEFDPDTQEALRMAIALGATPCL